MGESRAGLRGLEALNRQLLKAALRAHRSVTLDLDATAVLCDKRKIRYTYLKIILYIRGKAIYVSISGFGVMNLIDS